MPLRMLTSTPDKGLDANPDLLAAFVRAVATAGDSPTVIRRVVQDTAYVKLCRRLSNLEDDGEHPALLLEACRKADITLPRLRARLVPVAEALGQISKEDKAAYYRALGVPSERDAETTRNAYRWRARELPPDLQPDQGAEPVEFSALTEAYETLRDPITREAVNARCRDEGSWLETDFQHPPPKPPRRYPLKALIVVVVGLVAVVLMLDQLKRESAKPIAFRPSRSVATHPVATPTTQPAAPLDAATDAKSAEETKSLAPVQTETKEATATLPFPLARQAPPSQTPSAATASLQTASASSAPEPGSVRTSRRGAAPLIGHEIPNALPDDSTDTDLPLKEERAEPVIGAYDKPAAPSLAKAVQDELPNHLDSKDIVFDAPDNAPVHFTPPARPTESFADLENESTPTTTPEDMDTASEVSPSEKPPAGDAENPTPIPVAAFGRPNPAETGLPDMDLPEVAQKPEPERSLDTLAALQPIPVEDRLRAFIDAYCRAYESRDLERFRSFFAKDAVEQGQPLETVLPVYARNFEILEDLKYGIELKKWENKGADDTIALNGVFEVRYRLPGRDWQTSQGKITMGLMEIGELFRIKRLDYEKK